MRASENDVLALWVVDKRFEERLYLGECPFWSYVNHIEAWIGERHESVNEMMERIFGDRDASTVAFRLQLFNVDVNIGDNAAR